MKFWTVLVATTRTEGICYTPRREESFHRGVRLQIGKAYACRFPSGQVMNCMLVGVPGRSLFVSRGFEGISWRARLADVEIFLSEHELNRGEE